MQSATLVQSERTDRLTDEGEKDGLYGRLLAPLGAHPRTAIEVVAGMALIMGGAYVVRPHDPLFLDSGFPWVWAVATIFELRYGALLGVLAGLCVSGAWILAYGQLEPLDFPAMFFVGGFTQLIIAGHFSDLWTHRSSRLLEVNAHLRRRLASVLNNHYLLRVSHDRLEKDVVSRPYTLRDALEQIRAQASKHRSEDVLPSAQTFLEFLAATCRLDAAALFPIADEERPGSPAACIGRSFDLDFQDPLIQDCVEHNALAHVRQLDGRQSAYVASVPVTASSGRLLGILVVRDMPFLALNFDNLQLLLVMVNYYADGLEEGVLRAPIKEELPRCPDDFAAELARSAHMKRAAGIPSCLVGLVIPAGSASRPLLDQLARQERSLDLVWTYELEESRVALVLLPLTAGAGASRFLERIEAALESVTEMNFSQSRIATYVAEVDAQHPGRGLKELSAWCSHHG